MSTFDSFVAWDERPTACLPVRINGCQSGHLSSMAPDLSRKIVVLMLSEDEKKKNHKYTDKMCLIFSTYLYRKRMKGWIVEGEVQNIFRISVLERNGGKKPVSTKQTLDCLRWRHQGLFYWDQAAPLYLNKQVNQNAATQVLPRNCANKRDVHSSQTQLLYLQKPSAVYFKRAFKTLWMNYSASLYLYLHNNIILNLYHC